MYRRTRKTGATERRLSPFLLAIFGFLIAPLSANPGSQSSHYQAEETSMESRCKKEVIDLHKFFVGWFTGKEANMNRFERALAPDFQIIGPSGRLVSRPDLMKGMAAAEAQFAETNFKIWIEAIQVRPLGKDLFLVTYQEWQTIGQETKGRQSSALLASKKGGSNGLTWHHVHETWLPSSTGNQ